MYNNCNVGNHYFYPMLPITCISSSSSMLAGSELINYYVYRYTNGMIMSRLCRGSIVCIVTCKFVLSFMLWVFPFGNCCNCTPLWLCAMPMNPFSRFEFRIFEAIML